MRPRCRRPCPTQLPTKTFCSWAFASATSLESLRLLAAPNTGCPRSRAAKSWPDATPPHPAPHLRPPDPRTRLPDPQSHPLPTPPDPAFDVGHLAPARMSEGRVRPAAGCRSRRSPWTHRDLGDTRRSAGRRDRAAASSLAGGRCLAGGHPPSHRRGQKQRFSRPSLGREDGCRWLRSCAAFGSPLPAITPGNGRSVRANWTIAPPVRGHRPRNSHPRTWRPSWTWSRTTTTGICPYPRWRGARNALAQSSPQRRPGAAWFVSAAGAAPATVCILRNQRLGSGPPAPTGTGTST
jgi:hypothetical protein